ncbi:hypothetical protein NDU88_003401 [Pleurodeles waltl]|uniref:Uncharacterized protein n=1 Tax=Pleurodeles waltl TaxID=8319 RepID=A0AAV7WP12_PLEWA|nr:hypothetical protein NDU88_003401 [Pleurodeles waltl]
MPKKKPPPKFFFVKCRKETPTPPRTNTQRQTGLLQLTANAQKGLPRAAAANRSGVSPQVKGTRKEMNDPAGTTTNRNDGPTGTTHGRPQIQESSKANSNGRSRVGGSACEDQALIASVKMCKQIKELKASQAIEIAAFHAKLSKIEENMTERPERLKEPKSGISGLEDQVTTMQEEASQFPKQSKGLCSENIEYKHSKDRLNKMLRRKKIKKAYARRVGGLKRFDSSLQNLDFIEKVGPELVVLPPATF